MKNKFWQVKLDEEISRLCTYNTPFNRYSFCRLPFGVSSAPEVFEKKVTETFGDIVDDEDHDRILRTLLEPEPSR